MLHLLPKPSMSLRQETLSVCTAILDEKIKSIKEQLRELTEGAQNESKSSAGDKHETARAMAQLEQEKLGKQLAELERQKEALDKITPIGSTEQISTGTLVKTNKGILFLGISLGKITVSGTEVMTLSVQSPLGIKLLGKKTGDKMVLNDLEFRVEELVG